MKPNTAVGLLLGGSAILLLHSEQYRPARTSLARAVILVLFLIGALSLWENVSGHNFGIDQALFTDSASAPHTSKPGLMSPAISLCLVLAGIALWTLTINSKAPSSSAYDLVCQFSFVLIGLLALFVCVGYVFNLEMLEGVPGYTRISLPTAIALLLLSVSGTLLRPRRGLAAMISSEFAGSLILRRLILPVVLGPVFLAFLIMAGRRTGLYGDPQDLTFYVFAIDAVGTFLLLFTAYKLNQLDSERLRLLKDLSEHRDALQQDVAKATQDLRASEARYRTLILNTDTGYVVVDPGGRVLDANEPYLRLAGFDSLDAIKGKSVIEWTAPEARASNADAVALAARESSIRDYETVYLRSDGSRVVVSIQATLEPSDDGPRLVALCRDVTRRSQAEANLRSSEAHYRALMRYSPIGKAIISPEGKILDANDAWCRIVGYAQNELPELDIQTITFPEDRSPNAALVEKLLRHEIDTYETTKRYIHKSGRLVWIQLNAALVRDENDHPLHFISQVQDITQRRQVEDSLKDYTEKLANSNRELDDFAYIVSHDLKEPLRGIHNYSFFLLEDYKDKLDDDGKLKLHTLTRLTGRLEDLLDSLLFYSRVGRTNLARVEARLNSIIARVVESMEVFLREQRAEVRIADDFPLTLCDAARVGEVFRNLISNAVKYNDNETKLIDIGYLPPQEAATVFFVRDNGIGIPERHYDKVFTIFKRLHARDKYGGGTGSGLTIARKIVEQHGGRIWLESEVGQGTTFFFTLAHET